MTRTLLAMCAGLLMAIITGSAPAQITQQVADEGVGTAAASYPIPGSHLLWKQDEEVRKYVAAHPEMYSQMRLKKSSAWGFTVGSAKNWFAHDFVGNAEYLTASTCRAVGTTCYIFVEDSLWGSRVTQTVVDSVRIAFDSQTPANASKGIYQTDIDAFGAPPDVDSDPKIIILILNIRDGFTGTGGFVEGYFYSLNETNQTNSNQGEIYFLDANPTPLTSPSGLQSGMSTTAHEFQHMIHYQYDKNERTFINEGCSLVAEVNCGYPIYSQSGYVNETNFPLLNWRSGDNVNVLKDYSRAARFMTYIRDQLGIGVFKPIVASTSTGTSGIDAGLTTAGTTTRRFNDIFQDWLVANILDDKTIDPKYGYTYPNLPKAVGRSYFTPNVPLTADTVQPLAARYLSFKNGSNLKITFTTSSPTLLIKAVEIGPSSKRVLDVTSGVQFSEPAFGTTYTEVHFVVMNTSQGLEFTYTYSASGSGQSSVELKWDQTEPAGYLTLTRGDTVCVTFDGQPGGKLDSIRVALRRAGSMTGGVWRYTGVQRPTPLGTPLAVPIAATIATTTPVPYPVPFQNWATVDLRSYSIDASTPFAAAFACAGDSTTQPRVMVTPYASTTAFHSYTYYKESSSGANWYYLSQDASNIHLYLIRAYVSFGPTDVRGPVELQPTAFSLAQNYPNPFNPSTNILFTLTKQGYVSLTVYNLLGQKVATLVDEDRPAGKYDVNWKPENLASGTYIYRLQAGGSVETRKLLLLR